MTIPATSNGMRAASSSGSGTTCSARSITSPTVSVLSTVPRPGRCRSGIQNTRMTSPTTITTVPMLLPVFAAMPWWSTSYGLTPSRACSVIAIPTPSTGIPTSSCGSRRRSSRQVGTVTTSSEVSRAACPPMVNRPYTPLTPRLDAVSRGHGAVARLERLRHRRHADRLCKRSCVTGLGSADTHGGDVEALVGKGPHRRLVGVGEDRLDVEGEVHGGGLVAHSIERGLGLLHHRRVWVGGRWTTEVPGPAPEQRGRLLMG